MAPGGYMESARPEIQPFVPTSAKRILDVGCWRGLMGAALKARDGRVVWGIEPDPDAADAAATVLDHVIVGTFPDDLPPSEQFDCVLFVDVLEHIADPWGALAATKRVLAPGGHVLASIPNIRHYSVLYPLLSRGQWNYVDAGILDRTHLRFFTRSSIERLFADAGYAITAVEPVNVGSHGRVGHLLGLLGRHTVDFRAQQFVVLAQPR
jgi:O-antigen biosynthesis protein